VSMKKAASAAGLSASRKRLYSLPKSAPVRLLSGTGAQSTPIFACPCLPRLLTSQASRASSSSAASTNIPAGFAAALADAQATLDEVKRTKVSHKIVAQRLVHRCVAQSASLLQLLPERTPHSSDVMSRNSSETLTRDCMQTAADLLQQARDVFHGRDDLWSPREAAQLAEAAALGRIASLQAHFRGKTLRDDPVRPSDAAAFQAQTCASLGTQMIATRQLLSAVAWNAIGAGREAASIHSLALRDAVELLRALAAGGLRREDVPTPLMQSVCAALRDAMHAHMAAATPGQEVPGATKSQEQDRLLHVTHLHLELPGGPSNRTAMLAWVTHTLEALHTLQVPPSFFETLPGFQADFLPFLEYAVNKRTEALQLLQGLGDERDATAATAAALLGASGDSSSGFQPLEVAAFAAACKEHQGTSAQQLELLDAVAAASIARVRQGFVISADTAQLCSLASSLGGVYSDSTPPHLRHLAHMCAQQLYVRVGEWRAAHEAGDAAAAAACLGPRDACTVLHSLRRVLRGSPHNYGVDTSHGHKVAATAASEKWTAAAIANALRGRVSSTGHYHSISLGAPASTKQLSKMQIDSAARVCAAVAQAAALAVHSGDMPVTPALGAMGVLAALGEAHGSVASSTCAGHDVDVRRKGSAGGPVWKPWSRGKSAKALQWPGQVRQEARRLRDAADKAAKEGGFQSDLARMLCASHFWWQDLFPNGLSDSGPSGKAPKQNKAAAIENTLRALQAEPTVAHAVSNVYSLVLFRSLRLAVLDYRRIAKEYFKCAATGTLPQTAVHALTGGTESQMLSARYAAERQWGPAAFGFSDDQGSPAAGPRLGGSGDDGLSDGMSSRGSSSDSEGWLLSDTEDDVQDMQIFNRFRLQYAPSAELQAARVDASAAAQVRHFDECLMGAHAWILVDSMWMMKRRKQVAATVRSAALLVRNSAGAQQEGDAADNGVAAAVRLCLDDIGDVAEQITPLLVGAGMHQFRASVIRMLEHSAALLQQPTGAEERGVPAARELKAPDLAAIKRLLGPLRALHCRHTGQASTAALREAILAHFPAPLAMYTAAFKGGGGPAASAASIPQQAAELVQLPPIVLPPGASVESSTGGLLHNLYMLSPEALCGLSTTLGAHEFNIHFGTLKATPSKGGRHSEQLFGARVQRKRQTEAFRLSALEAQVAALRKAAKG